MAVTLSKTYNALVEAGASTNSAQEAAEEIAGFESTLTRLEVKINAVLGGVIALIIGVVTLVLRSFLT